MRGVTPAVLSGGVFGMFFWISSISAATAVTSLRQHFTRQQRALQQQQQQQDSTTAPSSSSSSSLDRPALAWTLSLSNDEDNGSSSMKLGNAVVDLPNGKDLAMTTASGSLHIVDTTTTSVRTFVPDLVAGLTETSCTSGIVRIPLLVVIAESAAATTEPTTTTNNNSDDAEVLLIYAVVDQAPGSSSSTLATTTSSRILAVSSRTAQLVWSISLPGVVVGTPVPSYNTFGVLYVVHNVPLVPDDTAADETTTTTTTKTAGVVTVLQFATSDAEQETDGATSLTTTPVVVATLPTVTTGRPFGPPSRVVSTNIYEDNNNKQPQQQQQQQGSGEDVLFLADATMTDNFGALFVVTGSEDKYNFIVASNAIGPSTTAPTVSSKTLQVYLGQAGASLVAWTDGAQMTLLEGGDNGNDANEEINPDGVFFGTPSWGWKVQQNETNLNDQLPVSPILSNDETILFIASAGREVSSFPLDGSVSPWVASDGSSTVLAKPVFVEAAAIMTSDIDEVLPQSSVYFVESRGVVRQYNAQTGFLLWTMDCKDSSDNGEECSPVEADFCVSQDGKMVYYGDVRGNLVAISVDGKTNVREISDTPSVSPSRSPVNAAPIAATRTRRPIAPIAPSMAPSHSPSTVGNVGFTIPTSILDAGGTVDRGEENVINSPESNSSPSFWSNNLLSYVVGASCGIVLVAIVLLFVYVRRSKNLNSKYSQREMVQGMKSNSFDEESPTLASMTPTKDRSLFDSSANNVSPGTLPSIIESPEDEDQASVGFEVGMNRSVTGSESEDIIRDLDDAFSLASKAEENECGQQTETSRQMPLEDAYSSASGSRSVGNSVESDGSASFLTKGLLAAAAAVGAITSGGMLFTDEKKEHGDADRDASNAQNFIQLTPSGDVLSIRSNPAPGDVLLLVQSASGDEKISWQSGSTKENSEKTNKSGSLPPISRFVATTDQVVSPFPSPHIVYPDASRALGQGTTSPNGSVISLDESLYTTDDITTMSLEMPLNDAIMARSAEATTSISLPDISEMAEDCPDDEIHSKLQPGAFFNSRQLANKETSSSMASHRNETDVLLDSQRTRPIYKGVSVRPASRSRAGIFSRRQPKLENYDNDPIDQQAKSCQPIGAPEMTPEPTLIRPAFIPRKTESKSIQAPLSPGYLPQKLQSPPSPLSPPRFTSAGYYVEEPILAAEVDFDADDSLLHGSVEDESTVTPTIETVRPVEKQMKYDPWGNFLTELSKVESQFFNPTTKQSKPMASGSERLPAALPVPPADVESDSDGEQHVPPPAPRTFFA